MPSALVTHGVAGTQSSRKCFLSVFARHTHAYRTFPRHPPPNPRTGRDPVGPPTFGSDPVVPGTGVKISKVGDDFEDPDWEYYARGLKSSQEMDEEPRLPTGEAKNPLV